MLFPAFRRFFSNFPGLQNDIFRFPGTFYVFFPVFRGFFRAFPAFHHKYYRPSYNDLCCDLMHIDFFVVTNVNIISAESTLCNVYHQDMSSHLSNCDFTKAVDCMCCLSRCLPVKSLLNSIIMAAVFPFGLSVSWWAHMHRPLSVSPSVTRK